ncbi:TATA element modulatory factor [Papilio machaon]|uniref:TATA element modulatory factor n=1 Tax=Papilio machaon TaxID=76193 RepID=A0A0N1PHS4_PAPMA|nr:TATA element modulatory factor [Papilio machaon]
MNWFDTSGLTSLAKTALKEAQKTIDKALDITDESSEEHDDEPVPIKPTKSLSSGNTPQKDSSDFFASWGLTVSAESSKDPIKEQPVVTESPSKSNSQSLWGSFAGSFFEQQQQKASESESAIVRPPKAKSMTVIADSKYGSQDDLFSRSQLVMSDGADCLDTKKDDLISKFDNRRNSSLSHRLSLVSSRNSSDSVEVLSHSLKTTPDSEVSVHTISNSSSAGQKQTSESVEILPDSLISPSSIECLGFDSYASDKNSSTSSNVSPGDISDKKSTPLGEATDRAETADSVSLVADDDEDTMSYNSISECTAPTVLDTDEKPISPFPKLKNDIHKKVADKEPIHLEHPTLSQKMQISENSSNDGSWSDRTLNADNDSIILEATEDHNKEVDHEDALMEKLSDSSSFYNVNVTTDLLRSESSTFVNIEKQQSSVPGSSDSSQKESIKERTSPISSDSKSDLVKIGSDRTSGHTSGDEVETATSSDIEIIPSPNGDNGHNFCRNSPGKYNIKQGKFDGTTSPNLVDLVLGKSLATKIRGHNRELSEASVQSNTSDESQGSENDRLMRRLCEMAEILDARESRLMEVSRSNAELIESNSNLKSQMESLLAKHDAGDINVITEDYTQRMSALEKKFQQAIREKDQLRKELDKLKTEATRKGSSELEEGIKERDEVIAQLQEEGEQLSRQQLHHSNIIKKLRAKDKDNEQVIKGLRDKISELSSELDRSKRAAAAKEELEVSQIEAVYRLTTANKKMETELVETSAARAGERERLAREEAAGLRARLAAAEEQVEATRAQQLELSEHCQRALQAQRRAELDLADKSEELERVRAECEASSAALQEKLQQLETQLQAARLQLDTERKRSEILQEQASRGDVSPPHSLASDTLSASLWPTEEGGRSSPVSVVGVVGAVGAGGAGVVSALGVEDALAAVSRREGSARALAGTLAALRTERTALRNQLADLHAQLQDHQSLQEQYDALLQMYGEKEEQLAELRLDLQDVTQLYKAQLDELVALRAQQR